MDKTFEQGLDEIAKLAEYFRKYRSSFLAPDTKEAQVRQNLIDPMFEALGWDVGNISMVKLVSSIKSPQSFQVFRRKSSRGRFTPRMRRLTESFMNSTV